MKIFSKQEKSNKSRSDFCFGNYGEKHKIKSSTKVPFRFIAVSSLKDKDDKVVLENL